MFGAVTANLFEYILGISQTASSTGFKETVIAPADIAGLNSAKGHITSPYGIISVEYTTENGQKHFCIQIPDDISAEFKFRDTEITLKPGFTEITIL